MERERERELASPASWALQPPAPAHLRSSSPAGQPSLSPSLTLAPGESLLLDPHLPPERRHLSSSRCTFRPDPSLSSSRSPWPPPHSLAPAAPRASSARRSTVGEAALVRRPSSKSADAKRRPDLAAATSHPPAPPRGADRRPRRTGTAP